MLGLRLIDHAWRDLHRLWSIRASIALGVFIGVASVISAFADTLNPYLLLGISVVANVAILPLTRIVKQKDPDV